MAAVFAFAERPLPAMPTTEVRIEHLLMLDVARVGERLIVVGERGAVFFSDDDGQTWQQATTPRTPMLTAVTAVDDQTLVTVGHDSTILRSVDRGLNWQKVFSEPAAEEPLLSVWFNDSGHGFAIGAYGRALESRNAGLDWVERTVDGNELHLNAIVAVGGHLLVVGEAGTLLRSDDEGATWHALDSPYAGSWFGALALPDESVLAFGMRGHLYRSVDVGETWTEISTGTESSLFGGLVLADGTLVLVGQNGLVLTGQQGATNLTALDSDTSRNFTAVIDRKDKDGLLLIGERGVHEADRAPRHPQGDL
ncbi:YCF48-related protein [Thioalkalicoccus limnaeus]|uniref:YCF48-related protein n=1 Tax=Thioalkalicoccus limnaeus TaxID=120681 RepID=A0ABV4B933_9GAMM